MAGFSAGGTFVQAWGALSEYAVPNASAPRVPLTVVAGGPPSVLYPDARRPAPRCNTFANTTEPRDTRRAAAGDAGYACDDFAVPRNSTSCAGYTSNAGLWIGLAPTLWGWPISG